MHPLGVGLLDNAPVGCHYRSMDGATTTESTMATTGFADSDTDTIAAGPSPTRCAGPIGFAIPPPPPGLVVTPRRKHESLPHNDLARFQDGRMIRAARLVDGVPNAPSHAAYLAGQENDISTTPTATPVASTESKAMKKAVPMDGKTAAMICKLWDMGTGQVAICNALNKLELWTPTGKRWDATTFKRHLQRMGLAPRGWTEKQPRIKSADVASPSARPASAIRYMVTRIDDTTCEVRSIDVADVSDRFAAAIMSGATRVSVCDAATLPSHLAGCELVINVTEVAK